MEVAAIVHPDREYASGEGRGVDFVRVAQSGRQSLASGIAPRHLYQPPFSPGWRTVEPDDAHVPGVPTVALLLAGDQETQEVGRDRCRRLPWQRGRLFPVVGDNEAAAPIRFDDVARAVPRDRREATVPGLRASTLAISA